MDTPAAIRFTYADYKNLPEESRYEILDGDLIMSPSPSARHQRIVLKLATALSLFVGDRKLGEVFISPFDVVLSESDVVQPDILFVSRERSSIVQNRGVFGAPDLAVEVLSGSTAQRDRTVKAKLYARAGVKELWLVDPEAKSIQVLQSGPRGFEPQAPAGSVAVSRVVEGFEISADTLF